MKKYLPYLLLAIALVLLGKPQLFEDYSFKFYGVSGCFTCNDESPIFDADVLIGGGFEVDKTAVNDDYFKAYGRFPGDDTVYLYIYTHRLLYVKHGRCGEC